MNKKKYVKREYERTDFMHIVVIDIGNAIGYLRYQWSKLVSPYRPKAKNKEVAL